MKKGEKDIDRRKLVLYLLEEISKTGRLEVEEWLKYSQENRDEYGLLEKTWKETGSLGFFPREINIDNKWESFSKKIAGSGEKEIIFEIGPARNYKRTIRFLYAAAAVVFLTWISVTMARLIQNDNFRRLDIIASNDALVLDTLRDGSSIQLNDNSSLRIAGNFNRNERKVELEGEAFFEVEPDSSRPFIIDAGIGMVKVLGTSFQVKAYPESDVEVFVEDGIVEISGKAGSVIVEKFILTRGQRGIIKFPDGEIQLGENLNPDELFWANKKLIFEETRLSLVFELLRKHYKTLIEVENGGVNACLLTATFNNEEIGQILAVIAASFDLTVEKGRDKFIIKGKGCEND